MIDVRPFQPEDKPQILVIYRRAFSDPFGVWREKDLPMTKVLERWHCYQEKNGFQCLAAVMAAENRVVGTIWWDMPTLKELGAERGWQLEAFARQHIGNNQALVWERGVITDPAYKNRKVATGLRKAMLAKISQNGSTLVLTRMRADNPAILAIATKLGFQPTGIKTPSHKWPDVVHQYWYKLVPGCISLMQAE